MKDLEILDCTIRDGGYYTNWDFDWENIELYLNSINKLPINYIEIGYRNPKLNGYNGHYYYCPTNTIEKIRSISNKKLAIILDEKSIAVSMLRDLLDPCHDRIELIRMAVAPSNYLRALKKAEEVKKMGFDLAFNVMYMSTWEEYPSLYSNLKELEGLVDIFYLVDSFGGVYPKQVKEQIQKVKSYTNVKIGFHGHNNLELALANSLAAIEEGVNVVDATVTGMGRGAGNLKTELLLTVLNEKNKLPIDFNALSEVTSLFSSLQDQYRWGTSLPYMVSGANSLPQKQVMEWVSKRYFSFNSIIRALANQTQGKKDNSQFPTFSTNTSFESILIIGGGPSAIDHKDAILEFLEKRPGVGVIHASSRNAHAFKGIKNEQFFCLVGNEGVRMEKVFKSLDDFNSKCILPPYPRQMGTYVPSDVFELTFELAEVTFTDKLKDTHTSIALQAAINLNAKEIFLVGYDGYSNSDISSKELELLNENEFLFSTFNEFSNIELISITPTLYSCLKKDTIYSYLV